MMAKEYYGKLDVYITADTLEDAQDILESMEPDNKTEASFGIALDAEVAS